MAELYGTEMTKLLNTTPQAQPFQREYGAREQSFIETVALATQTTSDTIVVGQVPAGAKLLAVDLYTDTSLGSSTIEIGTADDANGLVTSQTFTTTDTWTTVANGAEVLTNLSAQKNIVITIGTANFPASGNLYVRTRYVVD